MMTSKKKQDEATADLFGLIGGFPGDDDKFKAATDIMARLLSPKEAEKVSTIEIVKVLDQLPMKGRFYVVLQGIGPSPSSCEIVKKLFDWCFEESSALDDAAETKASSKAQGGDADLDQDFVLVLPSARDLNPLRNHILRGLTMTAGGLGEAGVQLCQDYLASNSTIFRRPVLQSMVKNPLISDDDLESVYHTSVASHQELIVVTCQQVTHRCNFLHRLYQKGLVAFEVLYANPDSSVIQPILEENPKAGFLKWNLHAPLYLGMLEASFQTLSHDPLGRGAALRKWEARCQNAADFGPEHAMEVVRLCDSYSPMEVTSGETDKYVKSMLIKASAAGELGPSPTDLKQVIRAFPICCRKTNKYEDWILGHVKQCPDNLGVGFVDPTKETFLSQAMMSRAISHWKGSLGEFIPNYLDKVSEDLFWQGLRDRDANMKPPCAVRFFQVVASICKSLSQSRFVNLTREVTKAWCRLHMRCQPPKVVSNVGDDSFRQSACSDWNLWRKSYMGVVGTLATNLANRHQAAIQRSAPTGLSSATLWVGFSRIILDLEIEGYVSMYEAGFVDKRDHVLDVLKALDAVERRTSFHDDYKTCHALAERVVVIVQTKVLPVLKTFDAEKDDESIWISQQLLPLLIRLCRDNYKDRPGLLVAMAHLIHRFSLQAQPSATLIKNPCFHTSTADSDGRTVRTFHRANVELKQATSKALVANLLVVLEKLCAHCSSQRTGGPRHIVAAMSVDEQQREIRLIYDWIPLPEWMLTLRDKKEDPCHEVPISQKKLQSSSDRVQLIRKVAAAWPGIIEKETPLLVALGKGFLSANRHDSLPHLFMGLGIDDKILDECDEKIRYSMLVIKNSNTAAPGVRKYLEEQTSGRDPTERMEAYERLLRLSFETSVEEFAQSLKFVANRTRNEAGIYRSMLLDRLVSWAYGLTEKSFVEASCAVSEEEEKAAIDSAKIVCEAFVKMFRDDVSKRDSVGKHRFLTISKELLRFCLGGTALRLAHTGLELHSVWVTEAVRLQWIYVEVTGGEIQLKNFVWQLPNIDISNKWVHSETFDALAEPLIKDKVLMRRIRALIHFGQHESDSEVLSLDERVTLLREALMTVQKEHANLNNESSLTVSDEGLSEQQVRSLFGFVKQRWLEVSVLVQSIKDLTPELSFERAYWEFTTACSFFTDHMWSHVPLLASTCETLFRTAVVQKEPKACHILRVYWLPLRQRLATMDFSAIEADPAVASFFLCLFGGPLKKDIATAVRKQAHRIPDDFSCSTAWTLLDMTESAWYLPEVNSSVEKSRDDILAELLESGKNVAGSFSSGVFYPYGNITETAQPPFSVIQRATQVQLRSQALHLYSNFCLSSALSKKHNIEVRSSRMAEFVEAPTTGYRDILGVLGELEEGPLLETLLLCIFRVDSAWKVLAYLLRPSVISKRSPRATGGLLDRVAKEMHARDVELVLSILLKEGPRQRALTPYLMKCILRALFDLDSEAASELIRSQWNRGADLHKDARHDLVRLAVLAIAPRLCGFASGSKQLLGIAWEIVESTCVNPGVELDSAVSILAPDWTSCSSTDSSFVQALAKPLGLASFQLPEKVDPAKHEAFWELRSKLCKARETSALCLRLDYEKLEKTAEMQTAIDRYGRALKLLSEKNPSAPVSLLARCHCCAFSASCLLGLDEDTINTVLKDLQATLEALLATCDDLDIHGNHELVTIAGQMAAITMHTVERKYWSLPAEVRTKDAAEAIQTVVKTSTCVKTLVAFLEDCAEVLLSTPPRETNRTVSLAAVLHVVSDNMDRFFRTISQPKMISSVVLEPLSDQIRVLKIAGSATSGLS